MGIYDSFVDNIAGKTVDGVVDSAINTYRHDKALENTFVWTAISRETNNGNIIAIIFINTLGRKQRIMYQNIMSFIDKNYVSNIIIENGQIKVLGCGLSDLPNYVIDNYGNFSVRGIHNENWVLEKAAPYIQMQLQQIQQDNSNNCLKTLKDSKEVVNVGKLAGSISDIKDISTATAVTAVTAAVTVAVADIGVAAKAVYKKLNSKQVKEMQTNLCIILDNYYSFSDILLKAKHNITLIII